MLCHSAKLAYSNESLQIIHIGDSKTNQIEGSDQLFKATDLPGEAMMYARLIAYEQAAKAIKEPLILVDTDMLITKPIQTTAWPASPVLCRRSFNNDAKGTMKAQTPAGLINYDFAPNQNLGELFPFLGCYLEVASYDFLESARTFLSGQSRELKQWYGDQVAIKEAALEGCFVIQEVAERTHACLPEKLGQAPVDEVHILHFKGQRKPQMPHFLEHFEQYGIQQVLQSFQLKI